MGIKNLLRHVALLVGLAQLPGAGTPAVATPLKYSDYLIAVALVIGTITASFGGSGVTGIVDQHTSLVIVFFGGLIGTIATGLSQWLQSKGD